MTKKRSLLTLMAAGALVLPGAALAHTPLFSCFDNGDGTILCEGGFSDGSSASGTAISVRDDAGKIIANGTLSKNSEIEFKKPQGNYVVVFEGGDGHEIKVSSSQIFQ